MKELSIEEKAKVYDGNYKAYTELINWLEDVKDAIKKQNYGIAMDILCKPYPEYQIITPIEPKISDDESVRGTLYEYFKRQKDNGDVDETWYGVSYDKILSWLEKQGKNNMGISETTKKKLDDMLNKALEKETPESWNEFLDKQAEKSVDKLKVSDELYEHIRNTCACIDDALSSETLVDVTDYLSMAERSAQSAFDMIEKQDEKKEINLVEILKHYPRETELYSPLYGKLWLAEVDEEHEIITCYKYQLDEGCVRAKLEQEDTVSFYSDGTTGLPDFSVSKDCMLFLYDIEKQDEQTPAWSEDDENRFRNLIYLVEHNEKSKGTKQGFIEFINRLKSLKERYTWKPSEEQIEALESATENCAYSEYQDCLRELIGQLKKLRGK